MGINNLQIPKLYTLAHPERLTSLCGGARVMGVKIVYTEWQDLLKKGRFEVDCRRVGSLAVVPVDIQYAFKTLWASGFNRFLQQCIFANYSLKLVQTLLSFKKPFFLRIACMLLYFHLVD